MKGVFVDAGSLAHADLDMTPLGRLPVAWAYYDHTTPDTLLRRVADAEIIITNKVMISENAMVAASRLRLICVAATGVNNVDLDAARRRGIAVCNVRGYATPSVAEHVFGLILSLLRHLPEYYRAVREGRWQKSMHFSFIDFPILELNDKTLGIIGFGELGKAVARIGEAFGMKLLIAEHSGHRTRPGRVALEQLLPQVDVLSIHVPLTSDTRGMIGRRELGVIKPGAILINTARGGVVDEQALVEALCSGRLAGAGIDVLTQEPPGANPLLDADVPNLIVTPHIAWASRESRQRLLNELAVNVEDHLAGRERNLVT